MKKYILLLVSAAVLAFTSCSDSQEIEIIETEGITFDVNTQSMYDEFSITTSIKEQMLRDKTYAIAVKSLIYDNNGILVDSMTTYSYNTNSEQHIYPALAQGKYTAVFVETLVYVENDFQPWDYRIEGVNKLSTLEIKQVDQPYWYAVIGVEIREFTLDEKLIQIVPKALGSIINCSFFDFTSSPCLNVGIGTEEDYIGYKLDPSLSEENRYITELMGSDYFSLLASTSIEEDEEGFDIYVLGKTLTYRFYYQTEKNANTTNWNYFTKKNKVTLETAANTYLGYAYEKSSGTVYDYYGTYSGMLNWYEEIIAGKEASLVPELEMTWGTTVSKVQSTMSGYTMMVGYSGRAVQQSDGSYAIAYEGKNKESMIAYFFTSATTGLTEADVKYPMNDVKLDDLTNYLNENYIFLAAEDEVYMYCNEEFTTIAVVYQNGDSWCLGFIDAEYLSNMSAKVKLPAYRMPQRAAASHRGASNLGENTLERSNVEKCVADAVKNIKRIH